MSEARALAAERCRNHAQREAVARCPGCRRSYCRECTTEHAGRLLCADCLQRLDRPRASREKGVLGGLYRLGQVLLGLVLTWTLFYATGRILAELPTAALEERQAPTETLP